MKLEKLEERLGYRFKDIQLLKTALTHPSFRNEHPETGADNQRMEFLGDAVIEIVVCHAVYLRFTDWDEGGMTLLKSRMVRTDNLANWALELGLPDWLIMGRGEAGSGGAFRHGNLADVFEAVIGAIFLDGGMNAVVSILSPRLEAFMKDIVTIEDMKDPKTLLQEKLLAVVKKTPDYREIQATASNQHQVEVLLCSNRLAIGFGRNRRQAERDAAKKALQAIDNYTRKQLTDMCK